MMICSKETMSKYRDLTGQRFGRLVVKRKGESDKSYHTRWWCDCDCGKEVLVYKDSLLSGRQISCGCFHLEKVREVGKQNKQYNQYNLSGNYGVGYTNKGEEFWFDLEDYDIIKNYCWRIDSNGYVTSNEINTRDVIYLHRLVLGLSEDDICDVDHIKHRLFDNRKSQIRIISHFRNLQNHVIPKNNTSGIAGVSWNKRKEQWEAYINIKRRRKNLGLYSDFDEAVKVRKKAEEKYFGEYSYDNSMKEGVV